MILNNYNYYIKINKIKWRDKQIILQLMEFHHFIQTMEFENQENSIESIKLPSI
jgi:hypothetical protein